jgi:GH24 family phage-related lysozyme (muramidase)
MPITMQCAPDAQGAERSVHSGHEIYTRTTHHGLVLSLGERNGYDDSDFYATVWNDETGCPDTVEYATTRGWTYANGATIDATPEVCAKYAAWKEQRRQERARERAEWERKTPSVNKRVRVVRGRNVEIGAEGTVFWFGADRFKDSRWARQADALAAAHGVERPIDLERHRVGVKLADGSKVFLSAANVEVMP